jgi:hypothetical protein
MERSILYVSRQCLPPADARQGIEAIVAGARVHNALVGITGALVCTRGYFAQLIEGTDEALENLMHHIKSDHRHTDVTMLRVEVIPRRRLPEWTLAYSGVSTYIEAQIAPLVGTEAPMNAVQVERLMSLMVGLANEPTEIGV